MRPQIPINNELSLSWRGTGNSLLPKRSSYGTNMRQIGMLDPKLLLTKGRDISYKNRLWVAVHSLKGSSDL